jgi:crotonobetainyl-CoA:carnitine CoA-transferase CaiB-like acyl-CoA transferase
MVQPLAAIRVIDFSRYIAGPFCASVLADLGAEVIRVEPPGGGEDRRLVPLGDAPDGALFLQMNRNKKSLAIDIKSPAGRAVIAKLVATADVVVTSMPIKALKSHGLDRPALEKLKPDIITANVSAFGPEGQLSQRTGFDAVGQAMSGAAYLAGGPGAPARSASSYVDYGTGLAAALGVLAAVIQRGQTGEGQDVQASLLATALTFLNVAHIEEAVLGLARAPFGNRSPNSGPSDIFPTRDGSIVVQVVGTPMFTRWARLVGRPELLDDARFKSDAARGNNGAALSAVMRDWTQQRSTADAIAALTQSGIPAGPVYAPAQVVADPLIAGTGVFATIDYPGLDRPAPVTNLLVRLGATNGAMRRAPLAGEHTAEILEELGLASEIEVLARDGIVSR